VKRWLLGAGMLAFSLSAAGLALATAGSSIGPEGIPIANGPVLAPAGTSTRTVDGIHCGATEQLAYHVHAHLVIFDRGKARQVPSGIGIGPPREAQQTPYGAFVVAGSCFHWLHTHAADGIIHIESPTEKLYTLGNFFDVWGQPLGPDRVGPLSGRVTVLVDGRRFKGSPRAVLLRPHAQIQLDVGSPAVRQLLLRNWHGL
jgi:hypothetical protein